MLPDDNSNTLQGPSAPSGALRAFSTIRHEKLLSEVGQDVIRDVVIIKFQPKGLLRWATDGVQGKYKFCPQSCYRKHLPMARDTSLSFGGVDL